MSDLAVLLGPVSSATHLGVLLRWLRWFAIACSILVLVSEWFLYRKGKYSLRRALWFSGFYGFIIVVMVFGLLVK
ncbi:MAG TPA: hypothetical protein VGF03_08695 [Bryobacteraceae bacterium]|jgi:hypothetical protein